MTISYDDVGCSYSATRRADPRIVRSLAAALGPSMNGELLEIGCGTGNYTVELSRIRGRWRGLDISQVMLEQAAVKASEVCWQLGRAEELPYADETLDGVVCINAIHFFDKHPSVTEVMRVLRMSGQFVVFTALAEQVRGYWLRKYFPRMVAASAASMPSGDDLRTLLEGVGFAVTMTPFVIDDSVTDAFLYSGRMRPEIYLDSRVRANMSQFVRFGDAGETSRGVEMLASDIRNVGRNELLKAESSGASGCTLVVATKTGEVG